jgi:hypothetical protein
MDSFLGYAAVQSVSYSPADNPTRLNVVWSTPRKDAAEQSRDLRKAEIFINNRGGSSSGGSSSEGGGSSGGSGGQQSFCCFELYRQVTQAKQQGAVGDYAAWWEFTPSAASPNKLAVRQRVAAFLQPQDALYFESGDKAVAVYDYVYEYIRAGG